MKSLLVLLLLLGLEACQSASHLRIRSQEVTKDYQLLCLRDSVLLVQDWDANRNFTWRTLAEMPLNAVDTIWQLNANHNSNVALGATGGMLATLATVKLVPELGTSTVGIMIIGLPVVMGIGALVGSALPSDDRAYLPNDPDLIVFLRESQHYDSYDDMPPILQEKIMRLAADR